MNTYREDAHRFFIMDIFVPHGELSTEGLAMLKPPWRRSIGSASSQKLCLKRWLFVSFARAACITSEEARLFVVGEMTK